MPLFSSRRLMALEEDKSSGSWKERNVCMGDTKTCSFPRLINHHHKFIISFAEDETGGCLPEYSKSQRNNGNYSKATNGIYAELIYAFFHFVSSFMKGSSIFWQLHTQVLCPPMELSTNLWTHLGKICWIFWTGEMFNTKCYDKREEMHILRGPLINMGHFVLTKNPAFVQRL